MIGCCSARGEPRGTQTPSGKTELSTREYDRVLQLLGVSRVAHKRLRGRLSSAPVNMIGCCSARGEPRGTQTPSGKTELSTREYDRVLQLLGVSRMAHKRLRARLSSAPVNMIGCCSYSG
ncbi:hypothetical protein RvY_02845 [Ramazzottius varieornatus]|uniref:Uncharacterized protein n=1 Tax=Ramazzottius varieornatus TaxID=947166 RepID=A0A1D1UW91_RAMVA|nr:hypothetical protein RvY_02845 [Ramazzottius varieornatus]